MKQFLSTIFTAQLEATNYSEIILALLLAALLSYLTGYIYIHCGQSLSDRRNFAKIFTLIAMATTLIIMVIKSSIALSLGLVGALSIVRFRAAIKEPEEIAYLFIIIGIGIGLGAEQYVLTFVSVLAILACVVFGTLVSKSRGQAQRDYNVNIVSKEAKVSGLENLLALLQSHASTVSLKRYDEDAGVMDTLFYAKFSNVADLEAFRKELYQFDSSARISLLEPSIT